MFCCMHCSKDRTSEKVFAVNGYWIMECSECQHRFAEIETSDSHPKKVYSDEYFEGGGAGYPNYIQEGAMLKERGAYYGQILNRFTSPGYMLDVGAAAGFLLKGFLQTGWKGLGVEPNARMAAYGREELGVEIICSSVEALSMDRSFDLISMVQVLPHFYDLNRALEKLAGLTSPGGYWLIETWNKDSLTARLTGRNWHEYSPPSVLHWFSPETVKHFGSRYGMKFVAKGRPKKKISGAHIKSLLTYKLQNKKGTGMIKKILSMLPDETNFPYPAEDLFWILLKKEQV